MKLSNMKIGARLGIGFGIILLLMATLVTVAILKIGSIGDITDRLTREDWVKADTTASINIRMQNNSRRTLESVVETDPQKLEKNFAAIQDNKKSIDDAVALLEKMIRQPEAIALLEKYKKERAEYVASFSKVIELVKEGKREEATSVVLTSTLPELQEAIEPVQELLNVQTRIAQQTVQAAKDDIAFTRNLMLAIGLVALALGVGFAIIIARSITRPLDEAVRIAQTVASGDLTSRIEVTSRDETGELLAALKSMNASLVQIVSEVRAGTDTIATASNEIASGNIDLSSRTEEQASSLEETASSMEQLASTVKQNAENARQANSLSLSASEVATQGGNLMNEVVATMGAINASSQRIVEIISVIDGLAFQTNLLALNAAVEAARAGEQGKGFAVVASEVRNLAQRSASAAKEIKALIDDSAEKVGVGTRLVDQAGTTMTNIVNSIQRVTDIMSEITAASAEQSAGIDQINQAVMQMDSVTQQNASLVEEAAAAAESLQNQAKKLAQTVAVFKVDGAYAPAMHSRASIDITPRKPATSVTSVAAAKPQALPKETRARIPAAKPSADSDWEEF